MIIYVGFTETSDCIINMCIIICLLTDVIFIWILQVLKKVWVYREYTCVCNILYYSKYGMSSLTRHKKFIEFPKLSLCKVKK